MIVELLYIAVRILNIGIDLGIAACAIVGAILAAMTRPDAFEAADRQQKWVWVALLVGCAAVMIYRPPYVTWVAMVITGIYWWDVRPQIEDILKGNSRW